MFRNCNTVEELKKAYRRAAMSAHPDRGGSVEEMQAVNAAYEERLRWLHSHSADPRDTSTETTGETAAEFIAIINALIILDGLTIELCGSWLWIGGDTKKHKDALKAAGCRWASKKCLWYWHPADEGVKGHRPASMSQIRRKYGSRQIAGISADAIRAC